ncbi:NIF-domain-containing protein [Phellopilus nigrolimitatus]|nr:NIF-domain-containing protein [Phellopilus nigrolimitatus]
MNSLSYLSRQFDVLASASVPNTPPSTPTDEHGSLIDADPGAFFSPGYDTRPPLKRVKTWSSVRAFFFPTPGSAQAQAQGAHQQLQQRRLAPPSVRARKRAGSTPVSSRFQLSTSVSTSALAWPSTSSRDTAPATGSGGTASSQPQAQAEAPMLSIPAPPIQSKSLPPKLSWVRRVFFVRVLYLFASSLCALWGKVTRSLRHAAKVRLAETEGELETSGDEKESDDDAASALQMRIKLRTGRKRSYVRERASDIVKIVLQPQTKPPTPSPLSQSTVAPPLPRPPTVNLIPPDPSDADDQEPASPSTGPAAPFTLLATLSPPTPPRPQGTQTTVGQPSQPAKVTPLHTRKTLVLDLDETLIHSTTRPLFPSGGNSGILNFGSLIGFGRNRKAGHMVEVVLGGRSTLYHVYKRPFVDYFLRKVSAWYTLVIFTASMKEYADPVIDWLDAGRGILALRFFREHCTQLPNGAYSKDLSVLKEDLARICLIDNSPVSYSINQANGIPIEGWTHDPNDEALLDLLPVLDSLRFTSDVRHVLGLRGF